MGDHRGVKNRFICSICFTDKGVVEICDSSSQDMNVEVLASRLPCVESLYIQKFPHIVSEFFI